MQNIRNIAIIAHVDHGKTTLVDKILHQTKLFRENQQTGELILDNNDFKSFLTVLIPICPNRYCLDKFLTLIISVIMKKYF